MVRTPACADRVADAGQLRFVQAGRLLEQDVFPGPRRGDGFGGMQVIGCRDVDDVDVGCGEQILEPGRHPGIRQM